MVKILDTYWFNGGGIVKVQTDYDGIKYYISGLSDFSESETADAERIAHWGSSFPTEVGDILFEGRY